MGFDEPTWVALLTPLGRGAVASILVDGPAAIERVGSLVVLKRRGGLNSARPGQIVVGRWGSADGEEVVVCRRSARRVEIHCHGGTAAGGRVVDELVAAGCRPIEWPEWIKRETPDRFSLAAAGRFPYARTERTASILLDQYRGALRVELEALETSLSAGNTSAATTRIDELLQRASIGRHLTEPWRVVIAGPPNVGKSSLLNAIVGFQRAIVFDQPGTTRDVVRAVTALSGWPVEFADTAGLRETSDELELAGIERAHVQMRSADLVLLLFDASGQITEEPERLSAVWPQAIRVLNKIDLVNGRAPAFEGWLHASARTHEGVAELLVAVIGRLVPTPPPPGAGVPITPDQVAALTELRVACDGDNSAALDQVRAMLAQPS
jgi:tRNA modification GTPase